MRGHSAIDCGQDRFAVGRTAIRCESSTRGKKRRSAPKTVLRFPDLDQAKSAVLNSLTSADAQRGYRQPIDEFVEWYCSEPRLSFNRTVVLRYRLHLEIGFGGGINLPVLIESTASLLVPISHPPLSRGRGRSWRRTERIHMPNSYRTLSYINLTTHCKPTCLSPFPERRATRQLTSSRGNGS